ncbi:hypothetical protein BCR44DRAFT_35443 [Catenaria anguillulae PL171]|uniref:PDZ domain-containing protein n=1 Tax=Catenaria anguillulae PL171 TaxID=765915 RepID=A0A1Y2HQ31_9FUNG|nr:hypothetical protein BCR44DRAFT_35443 [Catenaria anguillulae PL171]
MPMPMPSASPTQRARQLIADTIAQSGTEWTAPPVSLVVASQDRDLDPEDFVTDDITDVAVDLHPPPDTLDAETTETQDDDDQGHLVAAAFEQEQQHPADQDTLLHPPPTAVPEPDDPKPASPRTPSFPPSPLLATRPRSRRPSVAATSPSLLHLPRTRTQTSASSSGGPLILSSDTEARWRPVLERAIPAIATLRVNVPIPFDTTSAGVYSATGFFVDADRGLLLTNKHVVTDGPAVIRVLLRSAEEAHAHVVYTDPFHDFAIVKVDLSAAKVWRDTMRASIPLDPLGAKVGAEVRVPGSDDGEKLSILAGTIARVDRPAANYGRRTYCDINTFYIQASSNTSGGSSGSPVLNDLGRAIAINAGGSTVSASSFFLPLDRITYALHHVLAHLSTDPLATSLPIPVPRGTLLVEFVQRSYDEARRMGLDPAHESGFRAANPHLHGCLAVRTVLPGGPADGLLVPGDLLVSAHTAGAGHVTHLAHFATLEHVLDTSVGQPMDLCVLRGGHLLDIHIGAPGVANAHASCPSAVLVSQGDVFHALSMHLARSYLHPPGSVMLAKGGHAFGTAGIPNHAVIVKVAHVRIRGLADLVRVLQRVPHGARVPVRYYALAKKGVELVKVVVVDRASERRGVWVREANGNGYVWEMETVGEGADEESPVISELVRRDRDAGIVPADDLEWEQELARIAQMFPSISTVGQDWQVPEIHMSSTTELASDKHKAMDAMSRSLVQLEFRSAYAMDGASIAYSLGVAIVIDHTLGLVVSDRWSVPLKLGSVCMLVGNSVAVPLEVLAMDPVHTIVWLRYDPKQAEVKGLRGVDVGGAWDKLAMDLSGGNDKQLVENEATEVDEVDCDDHNHAGVQVARTLINKSSSSISSTAASSNNSRIIYPSDSLTLYTLDTATGRVRVSSGRATTTGYAFLNDPYPPQHRSINLGSVVQAGLLASAGVLHDDDSNAVGLWLGHAPKGYYLGTSLAEVAPMVAYWRRVLTQDAGDSLGKADGCYEQGFGSGMDCDPTTFCSPTAMATRPTCPPPPSEPMRTRLIEAELAETPYWKALTCGVPPAWITRVHNARHSLAGGAADAAYSIVSVRRVQSRSGAAGKLKEMDLILACDGQIVTKVSDLMRIEYPQTHSEDAMQAGEEEEAQLTIIRDGVEQVVRVPWAHLSWSPRARVVMWAGVTLQDPHYPLGFHMRDRPLGVYTSVMYTGSPAHRDGLLSCHFILAVDGIEVHSIDDFLRVITSVDVGGAALGVKEEHDTAIPVVDLSEGGWMDVKREELDESQARTDVVVRLRVMDVDGIEKMVSLETHYQQWPLYIVQN